MQEYNRGKFRVEIDKLDDGRWSAKLFYGEELFLQTWSSTQAGARMNIKRLGKNLMDSIFTW